MRMTRLGAVLASLAVTTSIVTVLADGPTQADTPAATTATLAINQQTTVKGQYGDPLGFLEASIADSNGGGVFTGSAVLQERVPGKPWANVKTDGDGTDGIDFGSYGSHAKGNVRYRLHYLGGTDADTSITYAPAYSDVVTVITLWSFRDTSSCPNGRCHISGRLIPKTARHKVIVQVKHGSWKPYRVVRTSSERHLPDRRHREPERHEIPHDHHRHQGHHRDGQGIPRHPDQQPDRAGCAHDRSALKAPFWRARWSIRVVRAGRPFRVV